MIYLSIGSNVGDRQKFLESALAELGNVVKVVAYSSVYETAPWGNTDQAAFLNISAAIDTLVEPEELLKAVKDIERRLGRKHREHWGPREIDIDIVLWHGNASFMSENLTIPHREYANRAFVVIPTLEVAERVKDAAIQQLLAPLSKKLTTDDVAKLDTKLNIEIVK